VDLISGVRFPCPFCTREVAVGQLAVEGHPGHTHGIMHVEPRCDDFQVMSPEEYLAACADLFENPSGETVH